METKINIISESENELEVNLSYDEIQTEIEEAYNKERKKLELPGFRKGKVPLAMVKKIYGDAIEYRASEDIATKKFQEIVTEQKLEPISTPQMTDIDFERGTKLTFKVKYEIKPVLDLKDYTGNEIKKIIWEATDQQVDDELNYLLRTNSTFESAETIGDTNNIITIDLQKIDDQGNKVEGIRSDNIDVDLSDYRVSQQLKDNAIGKKIGDTFNFSFHDHKEVEENGEKKTIHEDINYEAVVKAVKKIVHPELNDEFIQKITKKKYQNLEEWRENIKSGLQDYYNQQSEDMLINSLLSTVIKNNAFTPPHGYVHILLDRYVRMEEEQSKREKVKFNPEETHNRLHHQAEFSARWQIILANIATKENIKVEEQELKEIAEKESAETGISVDKLLKFYYDSNKPEALLEQKVIDFLKKNNNIKEVKSTEIQENKEAEGK